MARNDPPSSLRRGFGYHQAKQSGMGGIRQDRSPNQVNKAIDESKAARRIRKVVERDPEWGPFVEHWIRDGMSAEITENALWRAQCYARDKARGFSLEFRLRLWC